MRRRKLERLGEPLAELAAAGGGEPVLAPRRTLRRAPPPQRDEAAAEEAAERGVDLREVRRSSRERDRRRAAFPRSHPLAGPRARSAEKDVRKGHRAKYIKSYIPTWIKTGTACGNRARDSGGSGRPRAKNKGADSAPESRKYLGWNSLKEGTYFLPFFAFLVLFLAAFFLAGMWTVTSSWQI